MTYEAWRISYQSSEQAARAAYAECDALRVKIAEMERQEPVAWLHETRRDSDVVTDAVKHVLGKVAVGSMAAYSIPLYTLPGAQPTPSIPEGWKLVTIEPTEEMYNAGANHCDGYWSTAQAVWDAMLAAAPEAKP